MESEKVRVIEKEEELCCKDKEIQEVISELINRKYPGLSLETERGQRHHKAVFVANLLFKDTSREEININFITDRIDYMQDSKEVWLFREYILLLIENNIINNGRILRFKYFPLNFYYDVEADESKRLIKKYIKSNILEALISQIKDMDGLLDINKISSVKLTGLRETAYYRTKVQFKNPSEKYIYEQFIEKYLKNEKFSYGVKTNATRKIDAALNIFSIKEAKNIDKNDLTVLFQMSVSGIASVVYDYLEYLDNKGIEVSDEIKIILSYKKWVDPRNVRDVLLEVLKKEYIDRWHFKYVRNGKKYTNLKCYINVPKEYAIHKTLREFLHKNNSVGPDVQIFMNDFLIATDEIKSIDDLSYKTYIDHLNYFANKTNENNNTVDLFYLYVYQKTGMDIFSDGPVSTRILNLRAVGNYITKGYKPVTYNPIADIPIDDKLIVCLAIKETRRVYTQSNCFVVNFTSIENPTFRKWVKSYYWRNSTNNMESKRKLASKYKTIMNELEQIQRQYAFKDNKNYDLTADAVRVWKLNLLSVRTYSFVTNTCAFLSVLLRYAKVYENGKIDNNAFYYLKNESQSYQDYEESNANPISDNNLIKLIEVAQKKKDESMGNELCYYLIYLMLYTDRRANELLDLERNCLQKTLKNGENVLKTETKTSQGEELVYPISNKAKAIIQRIQEVNKDIIDDCNDIRFKNKLFLYKTKYYRNSFSILTSSEFNKYLSNCCNEANIEKISSQNLRDTYMTRVENYRIKEGLSDMYDKVLTGHQMHKTTEVHYVKLDFKSVYEAGQGVIIGNIDLKGTVKKEIDSNLEKYENSVENDTGYCGNNTCTNMTYLSCYLCPHFITSPRQLPQFEKQLEEINKQIKKAKFPHDKKDLVSIKNLLIGYIVRIKEAMMKNDEQTEK